MMINKKYFFKLLALFLITMGIMATVSCVFLTGNFWILVVAFIVAVINSGGG